MIKKDPKIDDYLNKLPQILPKEEQNKLFIQYKETGDPTLRDKLVSHNLKLAASVVLKEFQNTGLELEDLIQYASIVLVHAVELYDPYKNTAFSTYAQTAIENRIRKIINDKSAEPLILSISGPIISDDDKGKGDSNKTYEELFQDDNESHIERDFATNDTLKRIYSFVKKSCNKNEIAVFEGLMGIGHNHPLTIMELSTILNLSHQRIDQIKKAVSDKIKIEFKSELVYTKPPRVKKKNGRKSNAERARLAKLKEQESQA